MILQSEIARLRASDTKNADTLIALAQARPLILARALYGAYSSDAATLIGYRFSGGDLARGDLIRGELFGWYTSDTTGVNTSPVFRLTMGAQTLCDVSPVKPDLGGDSVAWHAWFGVRLAGGENRTLNSPARSSDTQAYGWINVRWGNNAGSVTSLSQYVDATSMLMTTTVFSPAVNVDLSLPASITLQYEPDVATDQLTVYGGTMEGL